MCMAKASARWAKSSTLASRRPGREVRLWFSYDSQRIGQGRENAKQFLKDNPGIAERISAIRGRTEEVGEALMVGAEPDDDIEA